jgi:acyl-coenzyme A thioesterase PaaI-like protein
VVAAALDEAMSLAIHAAGIYALTRRMEIDLQAPAPVGRFVHVEAHVERREQDRIWVEAAARDDRDNRNVAKAHGEFVQVTPEGGAAGQGQ